MYVNRYNTLNLDKYLGVYYESNLNFYKIKSDPDGQYLDTNLII